ncbi:hypothetical protein N9954_03820 [Maribacter sp.]|nr:hypothetical protein [Maribacter sp.]
MKRTFKIHLLLVLLAVLGLNFSCDSEERLPDDIPKTQDLMGFDDFWFGYRFEDPLTNPEDPTAGYVYVRIPETGTFEGELYFSFTGCDDAFDVGAVTGTVSGNAIDGSWQGTVDGIGVGGAYIGAMNNGSNRYDGTYTNAAGKIEIECDEDDSIFVAPNGTWYLNKGNDNAELEIDVNTEADPLQASWNTVGSAFGYLFVMVDTECLIENLNLEDCLMWSGASLSPSFVYGSASEVPAKPLVRGRTYTLTISAIAANGAVLANSSITFMH